jgi:uncharacterized membrane protein
MEVWGVMAFLFVAVLILTIVFAWVAFFRTNRLELTVLNLTSQIERLTQLLENAQRQINALKQSRPDVTPPLTQTETTNDSQTQEISPVEREPEQALEDSQPDFAPWTEKPAATPPEKPIIEREYKRVEVPRPVASEPIEPSKPLLGDRIFASLKDKWMVWLGGSCVGLSGIFLVKYSIDQGLLGPTARIVLALAMGFGFHALAAFLRKRLESHQDAVASLAGGASIILYAALLAALHLYQMLPAGVIFVLLAIISILTMLTAFQYGPLLAAIGILGAYAVPILVNTGSNNVAGALIYSGIITLSAFILFRWIFRRWLWIGVILASAAWWIIAFAKHADWAVMSGYLVVMLYAVLAIHKGDWLLNFRYPLDKANHIGHALIDRILSLDSDERYRACVIGLTTLAWLGGFTYADLNFFGMVALLAYPAVLLWLCVNRPVLTVAAVFAALGCVALLSLSHISDIPAFNQQTQTQILIGLGTLFTLGGLWNLKHSHYFGFWSLFTSLSPVATLGLAYLTLYDFADDKQWAIIALILALAYSAIAKKIQSNGVSQSATCSWFISAHAAYSLAAIIYLNEAGLTLALAAQTISLAYLSKQYQMPLLAPCMKALVAIIIARLTFNPYLPEYALTPHWPLWVFGSPLVCCALSWWMLIQREQRLSLWLQGASLHLLALTVISETRYLLYNGDVFTFDFTQKEAAVNTLTWGSLGLVYLYRAHLANSISWLYKIASALLLAGAAANYVGGSLLLFNPLHYFGLWLSDTPILNALLLMYLVPSLLLLLSTTLFTGQLKKLVLLATAASLFVWINMEIRHLWHGSDMHMIKGALQGELYTYSVVWLALAIGILVTAIKLNKLIVYRTGMIVLMGVVAKIFLFDMSGLTGLLRVSSFLGLGLCLLAIAVMHQKLGLTVGKKEDSPNKVNEMDLQ